MPVSNQTGDFLPILRTVIDITLAKIGDVQKARKKPPIWRPTYIGTIPLLGGVVKFLPKMLRFGFRVAGFGFRVAPARQAGVVGRVADISNLTSPK